MNKAFYVSSLVLSVLFSVIIIYYIDLVASARYPDSFWDAPDFYSLDQGAVKTEEGAWISLLFFSFFCVTFLLGLIKIKRVTNKVLSIIGLSVSALFLLWDLGMLSSPSSISFDEVGVAFFLFTPMVLAFSIVGIIQSDRFKKQGVLYKQKVESDLLDS
ncbi:hypothetical protein [uncultured Fluviicola sp.]|uniref:hypothetical protein n=1 Tax=uncultured Fluviicola sp. TaxID=463303 RepID=UPI0025DB4105|nr:hypothetical protein [uncultured Fluviicola sp.]